MRRREFIAALGGAAVAPLILRPLAARAQQPAKVPTIGFLGVNTASAQSKWTAVFVQRLRELGWTEGRNVAIEYRWAEGRSERAAEIAAELVRLKVDVIVTSGTAPVVAAKQATAVIPIVFALVGDPVGTGLVANLARPGGNLGRAKAIRSEPLGKRAAVAAPRFRPAGRSTGMENRCRRLLPFEVARMRKWRPRLRAHRPARWLPDISSLMFSWPHLDLLTSASAPWRTSRMTRPLPVRKVCPAVVFDSEVVHRGKKFRRLTVSGMLMTAAFLNR